MTGRGPATALLGVDLGSRRIGLALAEPATGRVRPLATLRRRDAGSDAAAIERLCREHGVGEVVVGLPLHLDGRESEQARETRAWGAEVAPVLGLPLVYRDERLTSEAAEARLGRARRGPSGGPPSADQRRARRARIDREAAAVLLEAEMAARQRRDREEQA